MYAIRSYYDFNRIILLSDGLANVGPDGSAVIARAEVPFEREIDVATLKPSGRNNFV